MIFFSQFKLYLRCNYNLCLKSLIIECSFARTNKYFDVYDIVSERIIWKRFSAVFTPAPQHYNNSNNNNLYFIKNLYILMKMYNLLIKTINSNTKKHTRFFSYLDEGRCWSSKIFHFLLGRETLLD